MEIIVVYRVGERDSTVGVGRSAFLMLRRVMLIVNTSKGYFYKNYTDFILKLLAFLQVLYSIQNRATKQNFIRVKVNF